MRQKFIFLLTLFFFQNLNAQISPPGLGDSKFVSWTAFAIKQNLDTLGKKQVVVYTGIGRLSNPNEFNPLKKQGIVVLNAEFYHQFTRSFQYSFALSYRDQNEYGANAPYAQSDPLFRQEFRCYGRFSHSLERGRFKLVNTIRAEWRTFFEPDFDWWEEDFQLRFRYRVQATFLLNETGRNKIIISAEPLVSTTHDHLQHNWEMIGYRESRFCFYFSHKFKNAPLTVDLGYMDDLVNHKSISYASVDLIWSNPFGKGGRKKLSHPGIGVERDALH